MRQSHLTASCRLGASYQRYGGNAVINTSTQLKAKVRNLSSGDSDRASILIRNYVMERFLEFSSRKATHPSGSVGKATFEPDITHWFSPGNIAIYSHQGRQAHTKEEGKMKLTTMTKKVSSTVMTVVLTASLIALLIPFTAMTSNAAETVNDQTKTTLTDLYDDSSAFLATSSSGAITRIFLKLAMEVALSLFR